MGNYSDRRLWPFVLTAGLEKSCLQKLPMLSTLSLIRFILFSQGVVCTHRSCSFLPLASETEFWEGLPYDVVAPLCFPSSPSFSSPSSPQ